MSDWEEGLSPEQRADWERFVDHTRSETVEKMDSSAFVMSLVPKDGEADIKFAVELGLAIMLDKPVVAVAFPGVDVPPGLRRVAHGVIELHQDFDTEAGREEMQEQLAQILEQLGLR